MRILFINPPLNLSQRYGILEKVGGTEPPIGLCYLAAVARRDSHHSAVIDASSLNLTMERTVEAALRFRPDLVGISAVTVNIIQAAELAAGLKARNSALPVIIGGVHVTSLPEDTMERFPSFDIGVIGEGEITLVELLRAIQGDALLQAVKGIAYRENGSVHLTGPRAFIRDMDTIPKPAWDLLEGFPEIYSIPIQSAIKYPSSSLITSRGCTGKCTFCDRKVFGNLCRKHSALYIFEMMEELHRTYGIRDIHFEDDNFLMFPSRLKELCEMLKRANLDLVWSAATRPDMVNGEMLKMIREAGCWQVLFGIESGSQKLLDFIRKEVTLEQVEEAVRLSREVGLKTKGFFMLGFPMETRKTLKETISAATRMPLDDISITYFTPFPGTEVYKEIGSYGHLIDDWSRMSVFDPVFIPRGFTITSLKRAYYKMICRFYFRPRIMYEYFRRPMFFRQIATLFSTAISVIVSLLFPGREDSDTTGSEP